MRNDTSVPSQWCAVHGMTRIQKRGDTMISSATGGAYFAWWECPLCSPPPTLAQTLPSLTYVDPVYLAALQAKAALIDLLESRGVESIYFRDGSQLNPGSQSLSAALGNLARPDREPRT